MSNPAMDQESSVNAAAEEIEDLLEEESPTAWEHQDETDRAESDDDAVRAALEDAESDEADDEADEGEEDGEEPEERLHRVVVNGEEVEVPYTELVKGYSRHADYIRKTQAVAAERRQVQEQTAAVVSASEAYAQRLEVIGQYLGSTLSPEQMAAVEGEYVAVRRAQAEHAAEEHANSLAEERARLLDALPEWKDERTATQEKQAMLQYAETLGFTAEDLSQVTDHRAMLLLRKAMLYDQMTTKGRAQLDAKRAGAPKLLKPGGPKPRIEGRKAKMQKLQERAARTGSARDAAAVLEQMIEIE
jgi:hypothetical protein